MSDCKYLGYEKSRTLPLIEWCTLHDKRIYVGHVCACDHCEDHKARESVATCWRRDPGCWRDG